MEEFERAGMLLGTEGLSRLGESTVAVFGVGGVGSHCIEALARGGVGRLVLADSDVVSRSNINRQSVAFQSTIGKFKTKVMENIIHEICPNTEVITIEAFVLPENLEELLCGVTEKLDYIVDAIDTVAAKLALAEFAKKHGIPLIASMGTGNKLHSELFKIADITETSVCPLCRVMRRELKKRGIESLKVLYSTEPPLKPVPPSAQTKEQEPAGDVPKDGLEKGHPQEDAQAPRKRAIPGSVSFVPPAAGIMIAGQVIRDLTGIH
ncbi:tRNA threonylcarbamoyladenosine dehydratase [Clostridium sp. AM29-11AC]|uniref:tRNA threonylcarbamoyladenosine dehydratase n=1 Tax=Clostridium sp. AM29-11AC TaxID=2293028 RepID=UPI000E46BAF2|nr:tRNA threonylcarbamoyladenosine dehydratase [Clostridium sp. AM29-11AC]RHT59133.1 tRNA threonylcarbamoyladenosine dehydratase [Clostridium sp. AM29-11AC]